MRIAAEIVVGQRIMPAEIAVVAAEPVGPIVAHPALLRPSRPRLKNSFIGLDAEIAIDQAHRLPPSKTVDRASEPPARPVDPAIQAVLQAVDARLVIVRPEAAEQLPNHVCLAAAIAVFGIEDVGGTADQVPFAPSSHAGRE